MFIITKKLYLFRRFKIIKLNAYSLHFITKALQLRVIFVYFLYNKPTLFIYYVLLNC